MIDLISRSALIAEYDRVHKGPAGGARKLMEDAPAVHAVGIEILRMALSREYARLYRIDEEMQKHIGCYNASAFIAGYEYALDWLMGKLPLPGADRKE